MRKKYKLDQITILCGGLSTHHLSNFWYTRNHNDHPFSAYLEMIQVHIDDEGIAAMLRCDQAIMSDAGDRTPPNALHCGSVRGNVPEA